MSRSTAKRAFRQARELSARGKLDQAAALYQSILREFPDDQAARSALDALRSAAPSAQPHPPRATLQALAALYGSGQFAALARECKVLIQRHPASFHLWDLLGAANQQLGRLDEALADFRKAIDINPQDSQGHYGMGVTFHMQGRLAEAEAAYRSAASVNPKHADALNNLGYVLHQRMRYSEAVDAFRRALSVHPGFGAAENNLGNALHALGQTDAALEAYRRALAINPKDAQALGNIGSLLVEAGHFTDAKEVLEKALAINPRDAGALNSFGVAARAMGQLDKSVEAHRRAIALTPDQAAAQHNLGLALADKGLPDEAAAAHRAALALKPDHAEAANYLGRVLQQQGRVDEAIAAYRKALEIKPDYTGCFLNLCRVTRLDPSDPLLASMEALHDTGRLDVAERSSLCFALAEVHDQHGKTEKAFGLFKEANALRKQQLGYTIDQDRKLFAEIRSAVPGIARARVATAAPAPVRPIFILGMPRSGTTLVEQIVSAHPQVSGGGELDLVWRLGGEIAAGQAPATPAALAGFRQDYLAGIESLAGGRGFVTDKMPQNFLFLGLIAAALPEAKILHVSRDPGAVCWSNYRQKFTGQGIGYSYDLGDVVAYFGMYRELMDFWRDRYPGLLLEVDYEALVSDQEAQTRALIAALGLEWSEACLAPEENARAVRTASNLQVRQGLYKGSSQKWRAYAPYLDGAFDALAGL